MSRLKNLKFIVLKTHNFEQKIANFEKKFAIHMKLFVC